MWKNKMKVLSFTLITTLIVQMFVGIIPTGIVEGSTQRQVVLVGNLQDELGHTSDWDPAATATEMTHQGSEFYSFTGTLPAGTYEYKIALNGTWNESYGANGGGNLSFSLDSEAQVTFYYNHNTHIISNSTRKVVLVGSLQDELGHSNEWDPGATATEMNYIGNGTYQLSGTLPAGSYEYKVAMNGGWDENYGANGEAGGSNIALTLEAETDVTFYYNDVTYMIADSTSYTAVAQSNLPRIVGNIQTSLGDAADWSPADAETIMYDFDFDNIYKVKVSIPTGNYEYKVTMGPSWDVNYGANGEQNGNNIPLNIQSESEVTFFFDNSTHIVTTDYKPNGTDGIVNKDKLFHNTWDKLYRDPFGAIVAGDSVTLRLESKRGDLSRARLMLRNYDTGSTEVLNMEHAGWADTEDGQIEFWEVTVTPSEKGVYGYKFIVGDQTDQKEYGEDTNQGKIGTAVDSNADMFQLTVYDPTYQTPDWMKEAVVYQIFPDRFYNGNTANDTAKANARGDEPIEYKGWDELPDNPRQVDDPNYTGDAIWSNDFFGGDVAGIHQKLDYLQSLGVNTLYLNPIAYAASNHKYDATDWKSIDPMFGTPEEFNAFTDELRARGMYLIMDGVFNHTGDDSIYFDRYGKFDTVGAYEYWSRVYDKMNELGLTEAEAKVEAEAEFTDEGQIFSPYGFHTWFNIENEKIDEGKATERYSYQAWWGFDSLPEIKSVPGDVVNYDSELNNQPFANYMMYDPDSVAKKWIIEGGSGWRLDVANEVDTEFWREFRNEIKAQAGVGSTLQAGEEPLILGEIWDDASKYFLGDQYDSVMNYRFRGSVLNFLKNGDASNTDDQLMAVKEDYPKEAYYALMNLMGSHDTARAVFILGGGTDTYERAELDPNYDHALGIERLKLAAIFQMGYPGAPTIYYGDEAGVTGSHDPDDRRAYPWGSENTDLINHYTKVTEVRNTNNDLFAHGELYTLHAQGDVYVFARTLGDKFAIVAINRGSMEQTVAVDVNDKLINGISFTDQLNSTYTTSSANNQVFITIPAMSGRMLVADHGQSLSLPTGVTNLTATEGVGTVDLSWIESVNASEYRIYQSTIQNGLFKKIQTDTAVTGTTFTVDGLDNGRAYYFAVVAVDENGNESEKVYTTKVIPHYLLTDPTTSWTGNLSVTSDVYEGDLSVSDSVYLDLSSTTTVRSEIWLEGVTSAGQAQGIIARLSVLDDTNNVISYTATYDGQAGNNNVFKSDDFVPLHPGTYTLEMEYSADLGRNWKSTGQKSITFIKGADNVAPLQSIFLDQPVQESGQVNINWTVMDHSYTVTDDVYYDDPLLYIVYRDGQPIKDIWEPDAVHYTDYNVANGTAYDYKIRAYDKSGNFTDSNAVSATPDLVMVDVTFRVNAPDYTPLDSMISIPGSLNGWNTAAWKMSRNGAVTPDWEYTVSVQDGTAITYKYVKGESWDHEGLADHTPGDSIDDDVSYYGYGAIGTDLSIVVQNQGNNKMVVQDYILRWIDMPLVIHGPDNGTTVNTDTVTFSGNAIKGGVLTINGEQVTINNDMTFSHTVELNHGENQISIHIEPSETSKTDIFKGDGGAIAKNTKDYTWTVTTTGGTSRSNGDSTGGDSTKPEPTDDTLVVNERSLNNNSQKNKIIVEVPNGKKKVLLPADAVALKNKSLELKSEKATVEIPAEVLAELQALVPENELSNANFSFEFEEMVAEEIEEVLKRAKEKHKAEVKVAGEAFDFYLSIINKDGEDKNLEKFKKPIKLTLGVNENTDRDLVGIYYINEDSELKYVGGKLTKDSSKVTAELKHFSKYAVLEINKEFTDVSESDWSYSYIKQASSKLIINGRTDTTYAPGENVKRSEFTKMLVNALGLEAQGESPFADVDNDAWYALAVIAANENGIVNGRPNGQFAPSDEISRQEMAVMIIRAYHHLQDDAQIDTAILNFADMDQVAPWAKNEVKDAKALGIINGKGNNLFAPQENATREEAAKMIIELLNLQ